MNEARNNIFNRLRQANAAPTEPLDRSKIAIQNWDAEERVRRFTERMTAVRAEIHRCENKQWMPVLEQICQEKNIKNMLYAPETKWGGEIKQHADTSETFPELRLYNREIEEWKKELFYETDAGITSTLGGIAETGSLIMWPTTSEPRLMSLVPPIHIAILEMDKLYTTFAEAVKEQDWASQMPTNALLVSGPSKSADIEQTLAYGVHGPKELVVLLL